MNVPIEKSWRDILDNEFDKEYFVALITKVRKTYNAEDPRVFPPEELIFNAFEHCHFNDVRVVILGQDPYHGYGQAHGLSFSVPEDTRIPPSLQNIYKEIATDMDTNIPQSGNLERWANQGALLLNSTLTVEESNAGSHQGLGWEQFTDAVIQKISDEKDHVVFLLWGKYAQEKGKNIDTKKHLVLTSPHPSPFSAHKGFFGCRHFSKTNEYLEKNGRKKIEW